MSSHDYIKGVMKKFMLVWCSVSNLISMSQNSWFQKTDFLGLSTFSTGYFVIGSRVYLGTGYDSTGLPINDFWMWDQSTDTWTQKANFLGGSRYGVASFSVSDKGYFCSGEDTGGFKKDLWEYDTTGNTWTQRTDLPGPSRRLAVGFTIGNKGYVGSGEGISFWSDFYEYDPAGDSWTFIGNLPGGGRAAATSFVIGTSAYIVAGFDGTNCIQTVYRYNSINNSWQQRSNFIGAARFGPCSFSIGRFGYVGTGQLCNTALMNDFWVYDTLTNAWSVRASLPSNTRYGSAGFSIGNKGYICVGSSSFSSIQYYDLWEYTPDTLFSTPELLESPWVSAYPNPCTDFTKITFYNPNRRRYSLTLFNSAGDEIIKIQNLSDETILLPRQNLPSGVYIFLIKGIDNSLFSSGKLIFQ